MKNISNTHKKTKVKKEKNKWRTQTTKQITL